MKQIKTSLFEPKTDEVPKKTRFDPIEYHKAYMKKYPEKRKIYQERYFKKKKWRLFELYK